ncbi:MAG: DUF3800 domain-containing protein [Candidatus Nomurabacteria bacterium]|jgi:hypothetical protein|nr:DUF3800 domain-containing protein [Candidatus Nomurabacteria bacterium]
MKYLYIDESGDTSFNLEITPRFFVVSVLVFGEEKTADRIVKKALTSIKKQDRIRRNGAPLHAHREKKIVRTRVLKRIAASNAKTFSVVFDKYKNAELVLMNELEFYISLLAEAILATKTKGECQIFLSRRYTKKATNTTIENKLTEILSENNIKSTILTKMHNRISGLQLVDFVAYATYAKSEHQNHELYQIIAENDKTLVAFAERRPASMRQGNYLSYEHYTKSAGRNQVPNYERKKK